MKLALKKNLTYLITMTMKTFSVLLSINASSAPTRFMKKELNSREPTVSGELVTPLGAIRRLRGADSLHLLPF